MYTLHAQNTRHGDVTITGSLNEIVEELYGYQPDVSALLFEEHDYRGYLYWDDDTSGYDEEDEGSLAEAKAAGFTFFEDWGVFARPVRLPLTVERVAAYAAHCLDGHQRNISITVAG